MLKNTNSKVQQNEKNSQNELEGGSYNQCEDSVQKNNGWVLNNIDGYTKQIKNLTVYQQTYALLTHGLKGVNHLFNIGNGGVFNYDTSIIPEITGMDLFLKNLDVSSYPKNATLINGDALDIGGEPEDMTVFYFAFYYTIWLGRR